MKVGTDAILLGAWAQIATKTESNEPLQILDIGTGTGIILLMLAQRFPTARLIGIELDAAAAAEAAENAAESRFAQQLQIRASSIQQFTENVILARCETSLSTERAISYDLIVSNPPFFAVGKGLKPLDKKRYHARLAETLTHDELLDAVSVLLAQQGTFCLILPVREALVFIEKAKKRQLLLVRRIDVQHSLQQKVSRVLLAFCVQKTAIEQAIAGKTNTLQLKKNDTEFTAAYKELTKDFYLQF